VNETHEQKELRTSVRCIVLMQNHKLPTARRAATQARETRLGDRLNSTISLGELFHPAGSPVAFYAD
jgi:hypothetical protein